MSLSKRYSQYLPNASNLGYALFLAVNATAVWGGVFPFLPMEVQTQTFVVSFFLAQSLVFAVSLSQAPWACISFLDPHASFSYGRLGCRIFWDGAAS
ncbi:MAG: hypothetical protein ACLRX5_08185 [Slackia sp.]